MEAFFAVFRNLEAGVWTGADAGADLPCGTWATCSAFLLTERGEDALAAGGAGVFGFVTSAVYAASFISTNFGLANLGAGAFLRSLANLAGSTISVGAAFFLADPKRTCRTVADTGETRLAGAHSNTGFSLADFLGANEEAFALTSFGVEGFGTSCPVGAVAATLFAGLEANAAGLWSSCGWAGLRRFRALQTGTT